MKPIAKYNICKGVSTLLTIGTPIITLLCTGDLFVHRSDTALSAAGVLVLLLTLLFAKDKLAKNFKVPSAALLSFILLVLVVMIENILLPIKCVLIATLIASGIDELTFKKMYKMVYRKLPDEVSDYEHFGFIFTSSNSLNIGGNNE